MNPIIVADKGWADTIPQWLVDEIQAERQIEALVGLMGKDIRAGKASLAELCAMLYTASLSAPLNSEAHRIYLHVVTKLLEKRGSPLPEDMRVNELSPYEQEVMDKMLTEIYRKRGKASTPLSQAMEEVFGKPRKRGKKNVSG